MKIKKSTEIVVGYGRVSSDEQATSGLSLNNQKEQCQKTEMPRPGCACNSSAGKTGSTGTAAGYTGRGIDGSVQPGQT